jgi:hypothetical protein
VGDVNFVEASFTGKTDIIILRYSGTNSGSPCETRVWTDFNEKQWPAEQQSISDERASSISRRNRPSYTITGNRIMDETTQ